ILSKLYRRYAAISMNSTTVERFRLPTFRTDLRADAKGPTTNNSRPALAVILNDRGTGVRREPANWGAWDPNCGEAPWCYEAVAGEAVNRLGPSGWRVPFD